MVLMKICPKCLKQYEDVDIVCPDDATQLRVFNDAATRLTGKVLDGRWLVQKKIAEGGMGEVYVGQQVSMNRQVAIKVLRAAMASSEEYVNRFFREANIASTIKHPNFAHIYDFGQEQTLGILYLAMEYLEGIDLGDRLLDGHMPIDQVLEIGIQVCSALTAAHECNIVHRDLKPENIFLVNSPVGEVQVKVLDFGIAKELGATTSVTRTGQIFGTPEYMSPEQCQNVSGIDGRSDLYSLGCVLYELLTGKSPFRRQTVIATLLAQVQDEATNLVDLRLSIPPTTAAMIHRLLQKSTTLRFQSAIQTREALEVELLRLRSNPQEIRDFLDAHRPTSEFDRQVESGSATATFGRRTSQFINLGSYEHLQAPVPPEAEQPARSSRGRFMVLGFVVAVVGGLMAMYSMQPPEPIPKPDPAPALLVSAEHVETSIETSAQSAAQAHGEGEAELIARQFAIMATSMALTEEQPDPTAPALKKSGSKITATPPSALLSVRTASSVEKRASKYSRQLKTCYALRDDMTAPGEFGFRFRILPDGSVDNVDVLRASPDTAPIRACIEAKIGSWTFAEAGTGAGMSYHERTVKFSFGTK
jgi:serine/threonine protein kinase